MRNTALISFLFLLFILPQSLDAQTGKRNFSFDFYGDTIRFSCGDAANIPYTDSLSEASIKGFYEKMLASDYQVIVDAILEYKQKRQPDDWLYYQLIRRTAQSMSPKAENYFRYTLYKWFLLCKSGYDARLNIVAGKLLFYVQNDEDIYDIPFYRSGDKKYICLNYHDYGYHVDFEHNKIYNVQLHVAEAKNKFSYRLTRLPNFGEDSYYRKELQFSYHNVDYRFRVKMNADVKKIFTNYPVVDYPLYFDMPLSTETYNSLIPQLKKEMKHMDVKSGVDYLMHFTRYAFEYKPDSDNFGREKHMTPEQTLLYDESDCADRAALFYLLVKEIYKLPMIVLAYPHHLTVAVKFDKAIGQTILFNGDEYTPCEPTPQKEDLPIGRLSEELNTVAYQIAYAYDPRRQQ